MRYAAVVLLSLLPLLANALEQGDKLAPFTLLDQYDQAYSLGADTQILLVARDMDGAKLVKAALAEQPKGYLEARAAVFVADIQRMPALISKLFAVPAMRDYSYRVLLDRDGRVASRYPGQEGQVQWLQLQQGVLVSQRAFTDAAALKAALENAPRNKAFSPRLQRGAVSQINLNPQRLQQPNQYMPLGERSWKSVRSGSSSQLGHSAGDLGHLAHHRQ